MGSEMCSKLNYFGILFGRVFLVTAVYAQTTIRGTATSVGFHDVNVSQAVPEAPATLRQISVELAGIFGHGSANGGIQFVLTLKNSSPED
jgi:hypothetical protein